jgi:transposase
LRQVEGIGPLTALTFVLTVEDPHRFEKSRSVGAFLTGLVPATDRSGDRATPVRNASPRRARRCLA